jgi:ABC-type transporter MlaC component
MKRSLIVLLFVTLFAVLSSIAQTPDPKDDQEQLLTLVKEVQAQQAQIAANQTKIDAKLADLAETLRVARIFSSRSR